MRYPTTTYKRNERAGDIDITVDVEALSRLREVFLIVMVAISVLSLAALFQYKAAIHHGYAYALFVFFGAMRYEAAFLFSYFGITFYLHWNRGYQSQNILMLKFFGAALVFLSINFMFGEDGQGGLLGAAIASALLRLGSAVAWILILSILLSGIFLMTRLSWYNISIFAYQFGKTFLYFQHVKILRRRNRVIDMQSEPVAARSQWLPPQTQSLGVDHGQQYIQRSSILNDPKAHQLKNTLQHFGIDVNVSSKEMGPVFTRYEVDLLPGIKSSAICNLRKDIARNMLVDDVKIIEVIPGKSCIGIEIPNANREICRFEDMQYRLQDCEGVAMPLLLGKTASNEIKVADLGILLHLLIAGGSGSGKTMLLQSILMSLTSVFSPTDLRIILIDSKLIAFSKWKAAPHVVDIITNVEDALSSLNWCVNEMEKRYAMMAKDTSVKFPKIVVMIDEFADLITTHKAEVESAVTRLAQKARECQIYLVLATQRPTVDVITGHIKANILARIALSVSNKIDSRIILDEHGAETLLGRGDMLFKSQDRQCERIHAPFVSDELIVEHVLSLGEKTGESSESVVNRDQFSDELLPIKNQLTITESNMREIDFKHRNKINDEKYLAVEQFIKETGRASASAIQSHFDMGYPRALKIMNTLRERGVIGDQKYHNGPCSVLI